MDRNKPCNCGSGNKFKKCCGSKNSPQKARNKIIIIIITFLLIIGAGYGFKEIMDQNRMGANPNATFCQDCGRYH